MTATTARELARTDDGRFGEQGRNEPDVSLPADRAATWGDFDTHAVLEQVGLPGFRAALAKACPHLPADRLDHWAERFKWADDAAAEYRAEYYDEDDETDFDGLWYDDMKALALEAIDDDATHAGAIEGSPSGVAASWPTGGPKP